MVHFFLSYNKTFANEKTVLAFAVDPKIKVNSITKIDNVQMASSQIECWYIWIHLCRINNYMYCIIGTTSPYKQCWLMYKSHNGMFKECSL